MLQLLHGTVSGLPELCGIMTAEKVGTCPLGVAIDPDNLARWPHNFQLITPFQLPTAVWLATPDRGCARSVTLKLNWGMKP